MKTPISEIVAAILDAYGWTETDLAQRVGCSQGHINRMKRGNVKRPNYEIGVALADLYNARPEKPEAA